MANMSFGVNVLPKTNNTYTLGNSDYKWNIFANQINGTNISDFMNKSALDGTGITNKTYSTQAGGEFTVTTVASNDYVSPHAAPDITAYISKHNQYRVTFDGTQYTLKPHLWYMTITNGTKCYTYLGNLGLIISDTSGVPGGTDNVPFAITYDYESDNKYEIWTQTAGSHTFLVEQISFSKTQLPASLIYGDEYVPIIKHNNGGTYNGTSIGLNELNNTRGTFAMGYFNKVTHEFSIAIGISNTSNQVGCVIGTNNNLDGDASFILGASNTVYLYSSNSTAVGVRNTIKYSACSTAVGYWNINDGSYSTSLGYSNCAFADESCAIGVATMTSGMDQIALGTFNVQDNSLASAWAASTSYAVGDIIFRDEKYLKCKTANSDATFNASKWQACRGKFVEILGNGNLSTQTRSNARATDWDGNTYIKGDVYVGCNADSSGGTKLAVTNNPVFTGTFSRGRISNATIGGGSFAFGDEVVAAGSNSIAIGYATTATGNQAHAEGYQTLAYGNASFAMGSNITSTYPFELTIGMFNVVPSLNYWTSGTSYSIGDKVLYDGYVLKCKEANSDTGTGPSVSKWDQDFDAVFVVGNGLNNNNRSNALTLKHTGDLYLDGDVYINSNAGGTSGTKLQALPAVTSSDNGEVLRVVDGAWTAVALPSASGVNF